MTRWTTKARSNAAHAQSGHRSGLTLLELMLVLGVLLIAGYFSTIALQSSFQVSDLEKAGEHVRKAIAESRAKAIEAGLVYEFRFEPGGNQFIMVPDPSDLDDSLEGSTYHRMSGNVFADYEFRKELESAGPSESLDSEWFAEMEDSGELASTSWSEPIAFSFDCLLYTSPSPRDATLSRMPSSA